MSSRKLRPSLIAIAMAAALPVTAQIESAGLGDLDAWGVSFLDRGEDGFSERLWSGSDEEYLLALMERIDVTAMTPAERSLVSRAVRSPADAPSGDFSQEMLTERLRLLQALGQRRAAVTLSRQIDELPEGFDADAILSDERLANGRLETVCAQMDRIGEGSFWSQLRAVCTLADDDMASAELAIEIAAQADGSDPWFNETANALLAEAKAEDRPAASYGSGLELALSNFAELEPDVESLSADRPDLAAQVAMDETRPIELRVAAAGLAAEAGELSASDHRAIYHTLIKGEEFEPADVYEAAFVVLAKPPEPEEEPMRLPQARPSGPLDLRSMNETWIEPVQPEDLSPDALEAEDVDEISLAEEQALAVTEALAQAATDRRRFATISRLFAPDLEQIPRNEDTQFASTAFAAAALSAGDPELAESWLDWPEAGEDIDADALEEDADERGPGFDAALLMGYAAMLSDEQGDSDLGELAMTLIETGVEEDERQRAIQLFSIWAGFDMPVPVEARIAVAQTEQSGRQIAPGMMTAITAAQRNGAPGEALLTILTQTDGSPEDLSGAGLETVLRTLQQMGAVDDARALALEAGEIWKLAQRQS